MERIISYDELPKSTGQSIYLRMETDPKLYLTLLRNGYKIVNNIIEFYKIFYLLGNQIFI